MDENIQNNLFTLPSEIHTALNSKKRILIIDDEQEVRLFLGEILVDEGYFVSTARDVDSAMVHLHHQRSLPDMIIVDLMMPKKSGFEFRREQMMDDLIKDIPTIFITGHGVIEGETCLIKPFNEWELLRIIDSKIK